MGFKMPHIAVIIGLVASGIALLFQIIAVAAVGWLKTKNVDESIGLWRYCSSGQCFDFNSSLGAELIVYRHYTHYHTRSHIPTFCLWFMPG